eukprot:4067581-Alexandrium_andersonii.AAC.1
MDAAGEGDDTLAITLSEAMAYLQAPASSVVRAVGGNSLDTHGSLRWETIAGWPVRGEVNFVCHRSSVPLPTEAAPAYLAA